ncbi:hypothetical protein OPT61_g10702 [Boeremia exigua]|uniref:Uncharacterized protein n=1 Tax=Boeremia exigua TaxID=749465 RepID=A0ACC2HNL9_9PLEO|nr:hypothetical protein OPT61_g10702 [Boeremia exigua]
MDLHGIPTDVDLTDPRASIRQPMLSDAAPSPIPMTNASDDVVTEEHVVQTMGQEGDTMAAPQEMDLVEQATQDIILSPLDDHLQALYDAYHTSYAVPLSETSVHMQHAQDLALALLQRHYPESHGYRVEAAGLGPYSAKGVNFVLKESNESDSDPDIPPAKKQKRAARKNNTHYSYNAPWHYIAPENMAVFVVKKGVSEVHDVELMTFRTHTYLVVILDDLSTFHRYSRDNVNHRGDVLSDLLGVLGGIQTGHGMLIFGSRLEFYHYDASNDNQPTRPAPNQAWKMDMRTASLAAVDEALHNFARQEVVYKPEA